MFTANKQDTKTHSRQYQCFVEAIEKHPELVAAHYAGQDQSAKAKLWSELVDQLNSIGVGPIKSAIDWQNTLLSWENSTRLKARAIRSQGKKTDLELLTPMEERLLRAFDQDLNDIDQQYIPDGNIKIIAIRNGSGTMQDIDGDHLSTTQSSASLLQIHKRSASPSPQPEPQSSRQSMRLVIKTNRKRSSTQQPTCSQSPPAKRPAHQSAARNGLTAFQRMWLEKDRAKSAAIKRLAESVEELAASNNKIMMMIMNQNAELMGRLSKK